jgi:anti-sigma factor RsiW
VSPPMSIPEIEELLGAYALDALDPDERAIVDQHLASCPRCQAELADHLEVAALLGNTGTPAPEAVWTRIAASLEEPPPALRLAITPAAPPLGWSMVERSSRARRVNRVLVGAVAAAVLVIVGLGAQIVHQERRIDDMAAAISAQGLQSDMVRAMSDPNSHKMTLASPIGEPMSAAAVMTESGRGYFMATAMPALADDQTYQLWGVMADGQVVSLGVLGHDPHMAAFQASGGLRGLAVTEEVKGGVPASHNPAVLQA